MLHRVCSPGPRKEAGGGEGRKICKTERAYLTYYVEKLHDDPRPCGGSASRLETARGPRDQYVSWATGRMTKVSYQTSGPSKSWSLGILGGRTGATPNKWQS